MGLATRATAFGLSALPAALESLAPLGTGELPWSGASAAALSLFPWLALATLPPRAVESPSARAGFPAALAALPALALGLGLDGARGWPGRALAMAAVSSWLALLLWSLAAELAAGSEVSRRLYTALWFVSLPGSAALWVACAWARAPGVAGLPEALGAGNPLIALHRWGRSGGPEEGASLASLPVIVQALLVLGLVLLMGRRRSAEPSR